MGNYIKGHTYLIRFGSCQSKLYSITILLITKTAYHIKWNNGLESTDNWNEINKFDELYSLVEDITDFMVETNTTASRTFSVEELKPCPNCNATGIVPSEPFETNVVGIKKCKYCWGSGQMNPYSFSVYEKRPNR